MTLSRVEPKLGTELFRKEVVRSEYEEGQIILTGDQN